MWSSDRRALIAALMAAAALGACGFRPLHGQAGAGEALRGAVALDAGGGRHGWIFADALRRRIGDPRSQPSYQIDVALTLEEEGLAISERDDVTRIGLLGAARYAFRARTTGTELLQGVARSASGYNTLASPYATRTARLDAERRVIEDLATRVWFDIVAGLEANAA